MPEQRRTPMGAKRGDAKPQVGFRPITSGDIYSAPSLCIRGPKSGFSAMRARKNCNRGPKSGFRHGTPPVRICDRGPKSGFRHGTPRICNRGPKSGFHMNPVENQCSHPRVVHRIHSRKRHWRILHHRRGCHRMREINLLQHEKRATTHMSSPTTSRATTSRRSKTH